MTVLFELFTNDVSKTKIGEIRNAGQYCHDCGITLCIGGTCNLLKENPKFYNICPSCYNEIKEDSIMIVYKMNKYNDFIWNDDNIDKYIIIDSEYRTYTGKKIRKLISNCVIELQCFEI